MKINIYKDKLLNARLFGAYALEEQWSAGSVVPQPTPEMETGGMSL